MKLFMLELELREAAGEKFIMYRITSHQSASPDLFSDPIAFIYINNVCNNLWMLSRSEMCSGYSSIHKEPPFNFGNLKNFLFC